MVEFQAQLSAVQRTIPASHGQLSVAPTGVLLRTHHAHQPEIVRDLTGLDLQFVIHRPPQLREVLLQLAEQLIQIAQAGS